MAQSRKSSFALLIALALFGSIIYYAAQDRSVPIDHFEREIAYGLDLDLKWLAEADAADFAVVQDTLSFVANQLTLAPGISSMKLQLHGIEPDFWGREETGFAAHLSLEMDSPDLGPELLAFATKHGFISAFMGTSGNFGWTSGNTDLRLPIPQATGKFLSIDGAAYSLRLAPRAVDALEHTPEA